MGRKKYRTMILSIVLSLTLIVGGTLAVAYFVKRTENVENRFKPAVVTCQVNANSDGTFDVTNTGNIDAYIRAAIVVNWMDNDGNVRGIAPASTDYTLTVNTTDWWQDASTGYYYYKHPVDPKAITEDLVKSFGRAENVTAPSGYHLTVEVVVEAIQADGTTDDDDKPIYQEAWGITSITGS